jgi:hypothetical protein
MGQQPMGQQSMGQQPMGQQPMGQQPMGQQPMGQQPMGQQPMGQQPMGQQPMGQQPMGQQPMGQQPMGQQPMGQQPRSQPGPVIQPGPDVGPVDYGMGREKPAPYFPPSGNQQYQNYIDRRTAAGKDVLSQQDWLANRGPADDPVRDQSRYQNYLDRTQAAYLPNAKYAPPMSFDTWNQRQDARFNQAQTDFSSPAIRRRPDDGYGGGPGLPTPFRRPPADGYGGGPGLPTPKANAMNNGAGSPLWNNLFPRR